MPLEFDLYQIERRVSSFIPTTNRREKTDRRKKRRPTRYGRIIGLLGSAVFLVYLAVWAIQ